jgi:hypothetical protein
MAPQLGLGHTSASSYHPLKGESVPPMRTAAEAEALKAALPKVISLDAKTATVDQIVAAMKIAGGLVIRNAVSHEALDKIESEWSTFLLQSVVLECFNILFCRVYQANGLDQRICAQNSTKIPLGKVNSSQKKHAEPINSLALQLAPEKLSCTPFTKKPATDS